MHSWTSNAGDAPAGLYRFRAPRRTPQPALRLGAMGSGGGVSLEGAEPISLENFDTATARRSLLRQAPVLQPAVDTHGRTVILVYVPGAPGAGMAGEVYLVSLLCLADEIRHSARLFGMSNLTARLCVALVESGALRPAAVRCGIAYQTARSEIADAILATGANSQGGLIHELARAWLPSPIDGERATQLVMETFGLNRRNAQVACLRAAGLNRPEAAERLGISRWAMEDCSSAVFAALKVTKSPELSRVVVDLMLAAHFAQSLDTASDERRFGT